MIRNYTAVIFLLCFLTKLTALSQDSLIRTDTIKYLNEDQLRSQLGDTIQIRKNASPSFSRDTLYLKEPVSSDTSFHKENEIPSDDSASTSSLTATIDAGQMEGTLDVSTSGGAVYSIAFILPPGIANIIPQVGLAYNSQGGIGTAGFGWNVSGLSSIGRVGSVKYIDDHTSSVNFDIYDRFALDGQRLLLKSGVYGGDGAEYQTEYHSNLKIISRGISPYGAAYGPAYFEIHYPDGSKAFYGQTSNSRTGCATFVWRQI